MRQGLVSFLLFGLLLVGMACTPEPKTRVIAHRGYWQTEGSAQNSIRSLERADEIGVYGAEFDVHYTADNVLVVYHDNDIQGKNIQTSNYEELKDLRLNNGETLPTLESYLKRACDLEVRLVFELKSHATPERNREAARASVEMIKRMGLEKRTDYISFNLDACKEFIRLCPGASVAYLNGELDPDALKEERVDGERARADPRDGRYGNRFHYHGYPGGGPGNRKHPNTVRERLP